MSSEYSAPTKEAVSALIEATEEALAIEKFFEEEHPAEYTRLAELRKEIPALAEELKDAVRAEGFSSDVAGYHFKVHKKTKLVANEEEILERATSRGDLNYLLDIGFIKYAVDPIMVERLDSKLQAIYGSYVERKEMTPAVTLPKEFKS